MSVGGGGGGGGLLRYVFHSVFQVYSVSVSQYFQAIRANAQHSSALYSVVEHRGW